MSTTDTIHEVGELLSEATRLVRSGTEEERAAFHERKAALLAKLDDEGDKFLVNDAADLLDATPLYERLSDCPSWCTEHEWDTIPSLQFTSHAGHLGDGEDRVDLYRWSDGSTSAAGPDDLDRSPEQLRAHAAVLIAAADILERG